MEFSEKKINCKTLKSSESMDREGENRNFGVKDPEYKKKIMMS